MTVLEMHIALDLFVQQMNSSAYRKIGSEEKDVLLNEALDEFIDSVFDDRVDVKQIGFEGNSRRLVDIKDLLVTGREISLYKHTEENLTYGHLPSNFLYPYSLRVGTGVSPERKIAVLSVGVMEFENDFENLYKGFKIQYNNKTIFDLSTYPAYVDGLNEHEERFILIDLILNAINTKTNIAAYWERFDNKHHDNQYIFVTGKQNENLKFFYDAVGSSVIFEERNTERYEATVTNHRSRLTRSEDLHHVLSHSLSKTKINSPVSTISGDNLLVYQNEDFASVSALLDYIRKPKKISLALGQGCEIRSESAQHRIVRLAGKKLLRNLESGSYQSAAQENIISQ